MTAHADRTAEYHARKELDNHVQRCRVCGLLGSKTSMDRHHINGRWGDAIFDYVYVHRRCHRWIHDNPEQAKAKGLLQNATIDGKGEE